MSTDSTEPLREQIHRQHRAALEPLMNLLKSNNDDFERLLNAMDKGMLIIIAETSARAELEGRISELQGLSLNSDMTPEWLINRMAALKSQLESIDKEAFDTYQPQASPFTQGTERTAE